jgi:hypothetical protein
LSGIGIQCMICKHAVKDSDGVPETCQAFPAGIPEPLLSGKVFHITPFLDDNGIMFETDDEAAEADLIEAYSAGEDGFQEPD